MTTTDPVHVLRAAAGRAGVDPAITLLLGLSDEVRARLDRLRWNAAASRIRVLGLTEQREDIRRAIGRVERQLDELRRRDAVTLAECELVLTALRAELVRLEAAIAVAQERYQVDGRILHAFEGYLGTTGVRDPGALVRVA